MKTWKEWLGESMSDTHIIRNPSKRQFEDLISSSNMNMIRGLLTDDQFYIWKNLNKVHNDVADDIKPYGSLKSFIKLNITQHKNMKPYYRMQVDKVYDGRVIPYSYDKIKDNKHINNIFSNEYVQKDN